MAVDRRFWLFLLSVGLATAERGFPCDNVVCAGNATCLIRVESGETVCINRRKPGTCPGEDDQRSCVDLELLCLTDLDCQADEICCQQDCQRRCIHPGEGRPKPGHCAARSTFGSCYDECRVDGECPANTKCCSTGCGHVCSSPAISKPGSCPVPGLVGGKCSVTCSSDSQCSDDLKCCSNGCGRRCTSPSKEPICPAGVSFFNRCNLCTCSGHNEPVKCDEKFCGAEKPGFCPSYENQNNIGSADCGSKCYGDDDCPAKAKCCQVAGCGQTCAPVAPSKEGVCPVADGNDPCGEFCGRDADCPRNAKCCLTGCGKTCKAPEVAGFCPPQTKSQRCLFRTDECHGNHDCLPGQICCHTSCGKTCSWPVAEKPGLCPNRDRVEFTGTGIFCSDDQQCSKQLKCCPNSQGGRQCAVPTEYRTTCRNVKCKKPGYYCIDSTSGPECVNKPRTTCSETVCDDDASCLQQHDKAICVPHSRAGHCPLVASALRPCQSARVLCRSDDDCPGQTICCTAGCVRKCVKPLRTDCKSIGHSLCRTAGYKCRDYPQGAVCVEDTFTCDHKRCPRGYVCHESFTGARCVKERDSCENKICAPGEICYEEEYGAICVENIVGSASINREVRAGACPAIRPGDYRGDCQHTCRFDSECPANQRCCSAGCARTCRPPVFRRTCLTLDCLQGHACIDDSQQIKDAICVNTTKRAGRCPSVELLKKPGRAGCSSEQRDQCQYDMQCPTNERCCSDGCRRVCTAPDLRKRCEDTQCMDGYFCQDDGNSDARCLSKASRRGRCPARLLSSLRKKCGVDRCIYDEQCPEDHKCCSTGCSRICVPADTRTLCQDLTCQPDTACVENPDGDAQCFSTVLKPGLCPLVVNGSWPTGGCKDSCRFDSQCADDSKCCYNGCAQVCLRPRKPDCTTIRCPVGQKCSADQKGRPKCFPIPCKQDGEIIDIECNSCTCIQGFLLCSQEECPPVKPGFCPKLTKGYKGRCVEDCSGDYDCEGGEKCCFTGCGHTCQTPVSEIVHPCKTVRFRCGEATECAATRGLCQPGKTCPLSPLCVARSAPYCKQCPPGKVCVLQKKACFAGGSCHRQPICIQLYSDDTIFKEDPDLEAEVVIRQNS